MMAKHKTGENEEWLAARLKPLKGEKTARSRVHFSADSATPTNKDR
jgi:hypothetical protein